jgi:enoyl-[acyl-carrier protein] reductase/trans-2-enoyl-CoA reductase (NAD+)
VQRKVEEIWDQVTEENLFELTDFEGYKSEFLRLFGFGLNTVDYDAETTPLVQTNF